MRLILKEDDVKLGDKGDLVTVADGFARNYLLPQGLAIVATPKIVKHYELLQKSQQKKLEKSQEKWRAVAEQINTAELVFKVDVGEGGKMYGSITSHQLQDELKKTLDIEIDKKRIDLRCPIRSVGEFIIPIKVFTGVLAKLKVKTEDINAEAKKEKEKEKTDKKRAARKRRPVEETASVEVSESIEPVPKKAGRKPKEVKEAS